MPDLFLKTVDLTADSGVGVGTRGPRIRKLSENAECAVGGCLGKDAGDPTQPLLCPLCSVQG